MSEPQPTEGVMSDHTRAAFDAEIGRLRASNNSGTLDKAMAVVGVLLAIVGIVTALVAYAQSTGFDDQRDQTESLILAAFGIALTVFGSALYLRNSVTRFMRYWLLRVIYEQRDIATRPTSPANNSDRPTTQTVTTGT